MFSVSECEIRKNSPNFSLEKLKVPGYNIHFPKSWDLHGYARVILYYKKTFDCPRVPELEDEHLQSIWVKFGFKNIKASSVDVKGSSGPHFLELRHRQSVLFWVLAYISEGTHARWLVCTKAPRRNFQGLYKTFVSSSVDVEGSSGPQVLELRHRQSVSFWVLAVVNTSQLFLIM